MKKFIFAIPLLLSITLSSQAQVRTQAIGVSVSPFDSTFVIQTNATDSFYAGNHPGAGPYQNGEIYLCKGATLLYNYMPGTSSQPRFYLDENATIKFYGEQFGIEIYAKAGAVIDVNNLQMALLQVKREASATRINSSNMGSFSDSIFTAVNYTFTAWPGAATPCNAPTHISDARNTTLILEQQGDLLRYNAQLRHVTVLDLQGKQHCREANNQHHCINTSALPHGMYLLSGFAYDGRKYVAKFLVK